MTNEKEKAYSKYIGMKTLTSTDSKSFQRNLVNAVCQIAVSLDKINDKLDILINNKKSK